MRLGLVLALLVLALAGLATFRSSADRFEARLVQLEAQQRLPSLADSLRGESTEINALFLSYADRPALWMNAALAVRKHGELARRVLLEYGLSSDFQQVLVEFGADAVLPIAYFHSNDPSTLRLRHWLGERAGQFRRWWRDEPSAEPVELDAYTRGLIGIALLQDRRYELINQFDLNDEGELIRLFGESTVSGVSGFLTSGLRDLERQWRRGDDVDASDYAWAGLDLLVMTSVIKVLRFGKAARASRTGRASVAAAAVAGRSAASLTPAMRIAMVAGAGYMVIRHPSLVSGLGANLADWAGWPVWVGQLLAWALVISVLVGVLRVLFGPLLLLITWVSRSVLRFEEKRSAARPAGTTPA